MNQDKNIKQLYDLCTAMITNLHIKKGTITQEEMYCLLSILDMAAAKKESGGFLSLLKEWQTTERNEEIDSIIKATLIQTDFKNQQSLAQSQVLIADLLNYQRDQRLN